ncbi:MAG TPA: hypothetical protein VIX58_08645 [Anaerolineae bacterium]
MKRFTIRRFELGSLARWGCVTGALTALFPGLCAGWVLFTLLRAVRSTVEGWRSAKIDIPLIGALPVNVVDLLGLQSLLDGLRGADALGLLGVLLFTVAFAVLAGLFVMLNLLILGLIFNGVSSVAGGIGVEVSEKRGSS